MNHMFITCFILNYFVALISVTFMIYCVCKAIANYAKHSEIMTLLDNGIDDYVATI